MRSKQLPSIMEVVRNTRRVRLPQRQHQQQLLTYDMYPDVLSYKNTDLRSFGKVSPISWAGHVAAALSSRMRRERLLKRLQLSHRNAEIHLEPALERFQVFCEKANFSISVPKIIRVSHQNLMHFWCVETLILFFAQLFMNPRIICYVNEFRSLQLENSTRSHFCLLCVLKKILYI